MSLPFFKNFAVCVPRMLGFFPRLLSKLHLSSFAFLNITQFLGGLNDNIMKLLIVYCFIGIEGVEASASILSSVGIVYVVPFLLFSQTGGSLADRYSKRSVIILMKGVEFSVTLLSMIGFFFLSKPLALTALFLLATHSALFGPCKYSIVPEIVPKEEISKANGLLTLCTYTAIIVGTFLASFLTDITHRHFVIASLATTFFALIGILASINIQKTPVTNPQRKMHPLFFVEFFHTLHIMRREPSLTTAVLSSAFFLFIGAFAQFNMIPFSMEHLHLTDIQGGYLFLLTALGIGAGSYLAGKFSGKAVELGMTPIGGLGMALCCFLICYYASHLYVIIALVIMVGMFGGFYLVPLDSFIQVTAPKTHRGQILAIVNFLGFAGAALSSCTIYLLNGILMLQPKTGFAIIGLITLIVTLLITTLMFDYTIRFFTFLISKVRYKISLKRSEQIPLFHASFFLVPYSFWPWAMVLLSSQRRRMRLFSLDADPNPPRLGKIALKMLPITQVSSPEALCPTGEYGDFIRTSLHKGISIAIFSSKANFSSAYQTWIQKWKEESSEPIPFFALVKPPIQEKAPRFHRDILAAELSRIA